MSKKANPTLIGAFVVAALALAFGGILMFSSSKWFSRNESYILYFNATLKGLDVGSPVKFQGITIGSVKELRIRFNQGPDDLSLPVIIEIDENLLQMKTDRTVSLSDKTRFEAVIQQGLRGKLESESLVTGRLYVSLDINPRAGPPAYHALSPVYTEIPTEQTQIHAFVDNLAKFDLEAIGLKLDAVLVKLDKSLGEIQVEQISHGLTNLIGSLETLVHSTNITHTLLALEQTLDEFKRLSQTLRAKVDPLADKAGLVLDQTEAALVSIRKGFQNVEDMTAPHAALRLDLAKALSRFAEAAQSVGDFADFLTRNPNALITGRTDANTP
jgi:paraquat-inducible protein B